MTRTLELFADHDGERLDAFLARRCGHELSRSSGHRLIAEGLVTVNGAPSKPSHRLRHGDDIVVLLPPPEVMALEAEVIPLRIVYQDGDVIVVDKPPGLTVHPAAGHPRGTLVNALLTICPELANIKGTLRPGIVHRLDKDTSGLLLVSKSDFAHQGLSAQLKARQIKRTYLALVHGEVRPERGLIDAPLGRDPRDRKRIAVITGGREARTHYRVRERFPGYTLLDVDLETGRTHQIRVHLAYAGYPVAGDPVYGTRHTRADNPLNLPGQALHARRIAFTHPRTAQLLAFEAPPPPAFSEALNLLRRLNQP